MFKKKDTNPIICKCTQSSGPIWLERPVWAGEQTTEGPGNPFTLFLVHIASA